MALAVRRHLLGQSSIRSMRSLARERAVTLPSAMISGGPRLTISDVTPSMERRIFPGSLVPSVAVYGPILALRMVASNT